MKNILLIALGACLITTTKAQDLKQSGKENNLQVLFTPLNANPVSISGISFRRFNVTGEAAWRLNAFVSLNNTTEIRVQADTGTYPLGSPRQDVKTSEFTLSIKPGYEKHFLGSNRLSPYCGAELVFSMSTMRVDSDFAVPTFLVTTLPPEWEVITTTTKGDDNHGTTFGLNLLGGVDYYIAKNLSLGAELALGFTTTIYPDIKHQYLHVNSTFTHIDILDEPPRKQGKSMEVKPAAVGQIKIGWLF